LRFYLPSLDTGTFYLQQSMRTAFLLHQEKKNRLLDKASHPSTDSDDSDDENGSKGASGAFPSFEQYLRL
jgi:hypothetical protein